LRILLRASKDNPQSYQATCRMIRFVPLVLFALAGPVSAQTFCGTVTSVHDGDTLRLGRIAVRLADIDAPELGWPYEPQPYGRESGDELAKLVLKRNVCVTEIDVDRYGRTVGEVVTTESQLNVNEEMVRRGAAWVYVSYNHDPHMKELEAEAQAARRGLWNFRPDEPPIYPPEWRRHHPLRNPK
jgi:micrococcal nuclease